MTKKTLHSCFFSFLTRECTSDLSNSSYMTVAASCSKWSSSDVISLCEKPSETERSAMETRSSAPPSSVCFLAAVKNQNQSFSGSKKIKTCPDADLIGGSSALCARCWSSSGRAAVSELTAGRCDRGSCRQLRHE